MARFGTIGRAFACVALVAAWMTPPRASAQEVSLAGTWVLDWSASQFPRDIGFGMDLLPIGATSEAEGFGGGSGAPVLGPSRESETDALNTRQLVDEVRRPPLWLRIAQTPTSVSITDDRGRTRTFSTSGKDDAQRLDAGPVRTNASWEARQLIVRYRVSPSRELRYAFGKTPDGARLTVEVRFVERNGRGSVSRVYGPLPPGAELPSLAPTTPTRTTTAAGTGGGSDPGATPESVAASGDRNATPLGTQAPDAELAGITEIGFVMEELTSQAAACGLTRESIESSVTTSLTAAGFKVSKQSDEDTYLYIDVMTASVSNGLCVSRFDASLFTHTTATLTHQARPTLVRVLLLHDGAMAGGAPKEHATNVVDGIVKRVDQFAARIKAATP